MSRLLLIDTAGDCLTVAVADAGRVLAVRTLPGALQHAEALLPSVEAVLGDAGLPRQALQGVAFDAGPGSFTGLRIGCAAAQGVAFALDIPVVALSSLAILAQGAQRLAQPAAGTRVLAVVDARMDEVYWQPFLVQPDGLQPLQAAAVSLPSDCRPPQGQEAALTLACGSGLALLDAATLAAWGNARGLAEPHWPQADDMAVLAAQAWQQGRVCTAEQAAPLYVRDRVALTTAERAAAGH